MILNTKSTEISIMFSVINSIGLMAPVIPITINILNILEPIAFPSAISTSFFLAATTDVTSSGREVPIATMVNPIITDGTLSLFATPELPSTKNQLPLPKK